MSDYNFSKYIRHTSSLEAPDGNKLLQAAGWVEASKKLIIAMTEVCSQAAIVVERANDFKGCHCGCMFQADDLEEALNKLAELDGGKS